MSTNDRALYTIGIVIEGVGSDVSKSGGTAFCHGDPPGVSDYDWVDSLINPPASIDDEVDPFTGSIRTSGFDFRLANLDATAIGIGYQAADFEYTCYIPITAAGTNLQITGSASGLTGTVVWIDDEALYLSNLTEDNGLRTIYVVERGYYSTTAQAHSRDTFIYRSNPYIKYRRVQLVRYDRETGTELVKWTGYIDGAPTTDRGGVVLQIRANSTLAALQRSQVNRGAPTVPVDGLFAGTARRYYGETSRGHVSTVRKTDDTGPIWMQLDDTLVYGSKTTGGRIAFNNGVYDAWGAPDIEPESEDANTSTIAGHELFVVDGANLARSSTSLLGPSGAWWRHPVAVAVALCVSTPETAGDGLFDCVNSRWSIGANPSLFDLAAIETLIESTPNAVIDHLILGWDGEAIDWFEFATQVLLRPYGFFWSLTEAGLITVSRLRSLGIDDFAASPAVEILPGHLEHRGFLASYNTVTALVGELPWREPDRISVASRDGRRNDSLRRSAFDEKSELEFDLRARRYVGTDGDVQSRLLSAVVRGYYGIPVIGVSVLDSDLTGASYDLGGFISIVASDLITPWFVDNSGARILLDAKTAQTSGQIIGRRYNFVTGTYELTLLLTSYRTGLPVKWRAPSAKIVAQSGGALTTVDSFFNETGGDAEQFSAGDIVDIWWAEGTYAGDGAGRIINAITPGTPNDSIALNAAFTSVSAGQILRLAEYDQYATNSSSTPIAGATGIVYVFLASGGADPQDIYG